MESVTDRLVIELADVSRRIENIKFLLAETSKPGSELAARRRVDLEEALYASCIRKLDLEALIRAARDPGPTWTPGAWKQ